MNNSGCNLLREARTKVQGSYLAGVIYSTCRVDLSRYPGPGRYSGIKADSPGFTGTYGHKCAGMSTGAWSQMPQACGRTRARHGRRTGTVGTGRTDVAHGTVSTRRMGRGQERRSWWYLGWSGTRRGRRVLRGDDCNRPRTGWAGPNSRATVACYCSVGN